MNESTVIRFERRQSEKDEFQCKLVSPPRPKTRSVPSVFDVAALNGPFNGDPVKDLGSRIFAELCKNPAIKEAMGDALNAKANSVRPIYIDTETVRAESICWEALWEQTSRFLALDQRWPIARRAQSDAPSRVKVDWFAPPLKILAVISAENYPGGPEWDCIHQAAECAIGLGLPVEIQVITGEEALKDKIEANMKPGGAVLQPKPVPADPNALDLLIAAFKPHIVHFFCHGVIEQDPWLVIRTGMKDAPLEASIVNLPSLQKVWLVVLNSCDSSVPIGDVPSMAYQLVATMGVPFVVGTLAPVDVLDAYKFSEAFYGRLLFKFSEVFKAARPKEVITIGWAEALYAARDAIDRQNKKMSTQNNRWTLPVLYARTEELAIITKDTAPAPTQPPAPIPVAEGPTTDPMVIRAAMVADLLRGLPPNTPDAYKLALVTTILNPKKEGAGA
jgi:CHAT domain